MAAKIIWYCVSLGCAALFFGIGVYAIKRKAPMWFWAGSSVDPSEITDVKKYNRDNGIMWMVYSGVFVISAFLELFSMLAAVIVMTSGSTVGVFFLLAAYNKIYKKYKVKNKTPNN